MLVTSSFNEINVYHDVHVYTCTCTLEPHLSSFRTCWISKVDSLIIYFVLCYCSCYCLYYCIIIVLQYNFNHDCFSICAEVSLTVYHVSCCEGYAPFIVSVHVLCYCIIMLLYNYVSYSLGGEVPYNITLFAVNSAGNGDISSYTLFTEEGGVSCNEL